MAEVRVLTVPASSSRVAPRDRERFAEYAAPESVAWHLKRAGERLREAERDIQWLSALLVRRSREVAASEWPKRRGHLEGDRDA